MPVIDVQVHPFDRNHPGRPWAGVDGAIMVSSFSAYEGSLISRSNSL